MLLRANGVPRTVATLQGVPKNGPGGLATAAAGGLEIDRLAFVGMASRPAPAEPHSAATPAPDEVVVEARGIVKRFGQRVALKDVGFTARRGELLAVIGPNGAGKTTLLSILAGSVRQDEGEMSRAAGEFGWVPQQGALYRRLTVSENLLLFARLERLPDPHAAVETMLEQTRLADRRDDPVGRLSGGNQQRVNIAIGLLSRPVALLLDEPSSGLDPRQRERLWEFVGGLARGGTTVVFSTHDIGEAERYATRLLVLADAEAIFDGSPDELRRAVAEESADARADRDFESAFVAFLHHRGH